MILSIPVRCRSLLLGLVVIAPQAAASWLQTDGLSQMVLGTWSGGGIYEGGQLTLTREWSPTLGGRFLQAEMQVTMTNGDTFSSRAYFDEPTDGVYPVVWLDEGGRMDKLEAIWYEGEQSVSMEFNDPSTAAGSNRRKWTFSYMTDNRYVEALYAPSENGWQEIARWEFQRTP